MIDAVIYISITRGDETLTLDGKLYLFRELLATLHESNPDLIGNSHTPTTTAQLTDSEQEGSHVTS